MFWNSNGQRFNMTNQPVWCMLIDSVHENLIDLALCEFGSH